MCPFGMHTGLLLGKHHRSRLIASSFRRSGGERYDLCSCGESGAAQSGVINVPIANLSSMFLLCVGTCIHSRPSASE